MFSSKRMCTRVLLLGALLALSACGGASSSPAQEADARASIYQHGPELVQNGGFTQGLQEPWETYLEGSGNATYWVNAAGAAVIRVNASGTDPWGIQLHTHGVPLVADRTYRLTFRARATVATSMEALIREHSADVDGDGFPWSNYFTFPIQLGTEWAQYTIDFTMPYDDPNTGVCFNAGLAVPGKIFIDDVSVVESLAPPRGTQLVGNGDFALGLKNWVTWLQDDGVATFGTKDGAATVKVTTAAKNNWGVQLHRGGIPLFAGHRYKLAFTAWAKTPLPLRALVQENGHDINGDGFAYTAYKDVTYTLGTTPQRYSVQFEVPFTNVDAGVFFFFGAATGKYFVDDVKVVEVAPQPPVYPAVGAVDGSEDEVVFRPGQVLTYEVTMTQADWDYVEAHGVGEEWMPATLTVRGEEGAVPVELGQVGLRHKGGYGTLDTCWGPPTINEDDNPDVVTHAEMLSRPRLDESWCRKISYKFKFNNYVKGTRLHGLKKLNLHAESRDSSLLRDMLAYSTYYDFGVDAPRTSPARLVINGEFQGLFIAVEDVDDRYAAYHYPDAAGGNLYKEIWPNPDAAARMGESFTEYVSGGQEEGDDPSDFLALTSGVQTAAGQGSTDAISSLVDVDGLMRYMAVDRGISNWDGVTALYTCPGPGCSHVGPHNYYWYRDTSDAARFHLVPWDMDNTFAPCDPYVESCGYGADWPVPNWNVKPTYCAPMRVWGSSWVIPSGCDQFLNLLASSEWARFDEAARQLIAGPLDPTVLQAKALAWSRLIEPIVEEDPTLNANVWRRERNALLKTALPRAASKLASLLEQGYVVQPPPPEPGVNLLSNGAFDAGLNGWTTYLGDSAAATFSAGAGEGVVSILAPDYFYSVQLSYNGLPLEPGKHYRLSFRARADSARNIETSIWENGHDLENDGYAWASYQFDTHVIGTDMATYSSAEFEMPLFNLDAGVCFFLGESTGEVVIDDVSLVEVL